MSKALTTKIDKANTQLDVAYAQGILTAEEVDQRRLNISPIDLAEDANFTRYHIKLNEVDEAIKDVKQKRSGEMEQRLASLTNVSVEERERIQRAIQNGRFQVAEDYIERVQNKRSLPQVKVETSHAFDDFFPDFVEDYTSFRDQTEGTSNVLSLVQSALENRGIAGPVSAEHLSKDASYDSARLLRAWSELHTTKIANEKLREFISALGFKDVKLSPYKDQTVAGKTSRPPEEKPIANRQIVHRLLEVEPIADRQIAQLPDFGSRANGRYRLIGGARLRDRRSDYPRN